MAETAIDSEEFLRSVKRYRMRVLAPAGLDHSDARRRIGSHFPGHCTFEAGNQVWKFYAASRARNARNTVKASRRLRSAGIPTPPISYVDVRYESVKEHGIACIMMDRIEAVPIDPSELRDAGTALASLLAGLHSLTSESWGDLTWQPGGANLEQFVRNSAAGLLGDIRSREEGLHLAPFEALDSWMERRRRGGSLDTAAFQLVHGDLHESNILRETDGSLHLIDLDFSGYRMFGLDLTNLIQRMNPTPAPSPNPETAMHLWEEAARPFLKAYFELTPPDFPDQWQRFRPVGFLLANLRAYLEGLRAFSLRARRPPQKDPLLVELETRRVLIDAILKT